MELTARVRNQDRAAAVHMALSRREKERAASVRKRTINETIISAADAQDHDPNKDERPELWRSRPKIVGAIF